jgi:hypothetical protein
MKWAASTRQYQMERVKIWDEEKGSEIVLSVCTTLKYLVNLESAVLSSCLLGLLQFHVDVLGRTRLTSSKPAENSNVWKVLKQNSDKFL